ncbi:MAG: hypothetical protein P1U89_01815 [Verrucomicrobiales bacterium]|nr:hypothetical protein [Verrucomicrobiales bacterium]
MRLILHALVITVALLLPLESRSQTPEEKKNVFIKKQPEKQYAAQLGIILEYFQLDEKIANQLLRKYAPTASDAKALRYDLDTMVESGEAKLLETAFIIARSGNRAKVESIREYQYPTEYEPQTVPNTVGDITVVAQDGGTLPAKSQILFTEPTPAKYEVRNVGITLEVDAVLGADNRIVDLNLAPEITTLIETDHYVSGDREAHGTGNIKMPVFYTMKTTTQITVEVGKENLFAFNTPPEAPGERVISMIKVELIKVPSPPTVE